MKYIDYNSLKDFYTISEVCELFEMSKDALKDKCEQYDIAPRRNEIGEGVFAKYDVRRLHNELYYEERDHKKEWDPWA
jgi:hypothetical protein